MYISVFLPYARAVQGAVAAGVAEILLLTRCRIRATLTHKWN